MQLLRWRPVGVMPFELADVRAPRRTPQAPLVTVDHRAMHPDDSQRANDLGVIRQALVILVALALGAAGLFGVDQMKKSNAKTNACLEQLQSNVDAVACDP
jgi:uncharacterized protein HemX